jgi:mRNA-degrading endonuclease RelE of RelBE toxin-antitoxin system
VEFKATPTFAKAFKRLKKKYRSLEDDINSLRKTLTENPTAGIPPGAGLYKIRLASSDMAKGKSGAFRVIYFLMISADKIVLLDLYAKPEQENVPISELRELLENYLKGQ